MFYRPAVYMQDLESTLSYSFHQEIAIHKNIEGDSLDALKQFLRILVKVILLLYFLKFCIRPCKKKISGSQIIDLKNMDR